MVDALQSVFMILAVTLGAVCMWLIGASAPRYWRVWLENTDPNETERYLALNGYLCMASALGCFQGQNMTWQWFGIVADEMMWMGFAFAACGLVLVLIADAKLPTTLWLIRMKREHRPKPRD